MVCNLFRLKNIHFLQLKSGFAYELVDVHSCYMVKELVQ